MPLFECLYCCQEHFVLSKMCDGILQIKHCYPMQPLAYQMAKKKSTKYADLVDPFEAFREIVSKQSSPQNVNLTEVGIAKE